MEGTAKHQLTGKWRITEMELWDADFLDLVQPAFTISSNPSQVKSTLWLAVHGDGDAELQGDGTLTGELRYHRGGESTFKARRW